MGTKSQFTSKPIVYVMKPAVALLWVGLWSGAAPARAQEELPALRPGQVVPGTIAAGNAVVETDTLLAGYTLAPTIGSRYRIEVEEPGTYRVELRSCYFDAYLVVRDEAGGVLAEDDDGLVGTHAQVVMEVEPGSALVAEACALHGGLGEFEVVLLPGAPQTLDPLARSEASIAETRRCIEVLERALGPDHPDLATSLNTLASLLEAAGAYDEARSAYERSLTIREASLGPDHPDVATSLNNLGALLVSMGADAEARPLFDRSLAIWEAVLGPEHPLVATSLNNLAALLEQMGQSKEALPLFERSLSIREAALGPNHPGVAASLNRIANVRLAMGAYAEARALYERSLAILEAAMGPNHPDVAAILNNLGALLWSLGAYTEARPLYERALAIREAALGPSHPDVAGSLSNLANLLQSTGAYGEARSLHERALAIREAALGPDHVEVAGSLRGLADQLSEMGAYDEARSLHERALAICEARLGPDHPQVAISQNHLASLLRVMGAYGEARLLLERSLAIREAFLGPDHPEVAESLNNLAELLRVMGAYAEARPLYERSLAILAAALGPDHPHVASALNDLALLLHSTGASAEARPLYERSLSVREASLGPGHPVVGWSLNNLAVLLHDTGAYAEARPLYERSLAILEAALGPDHPDVAMLRSSISLLELDLGDIDSAIATRARTDASRARHLAQLVAGSSATDMRQYTAIVARQVKLAQIPVMVRHDPEASYGTLLAWKGQVLRFEQSGRKALQERVGPDARALATRLGAVSAALSRAFLASNRGESAVNAAQLESLLAERQRLEREFAPLAADLLPEVPSWADLRAALPPKSALIDIFIHTSYVPARREGDVVVEKGRVTEKQVSAWITRPDSTEPLHVDLGPEAAHEAAARGALALAGVTRGVSPVARAETTAGSSRLIWEALHPHLEGCETLIVSPDGVLATLPLEVLREADGRYLVESRRIVYLTDPTDVVRLRDSDGTAGQSLLAVGDVDFDRAFDEETGSSPAKAGALATTPGSPTSTGELRGALVVTWERLAATAPEVAQVVEEHTAAHPDADRRSLTGAAATEERLKSLLPRYSLIHLATHGYFNPEGLPSLTEAAGLAGEEQRTGPARIGESGADLDRSLEGYAPGVLSGLVCAGANSDLQPPRDDGYLTAEEVGWLDLSGVELVVLSACDTGLGRPQSGEGLLGLRRAFLTAGARTVISSLWSVPDQETAELMGLFYENLWQKQMGKHEALRAAQLELLARNRQRFDGDARPVTWGAFVLDGDWR